jgi:hypothetical protein
MGNLLEPPSSANLYVHQLRQTLNAYSPTQVVIGEALQNAIDAVVSAGLGPNKITVRIDFDTNTVSVKDDGDGFPNDVNLLFLGGARKRIPSKKLVGQVGVGMKVVIFSTSTFRVPMRNADGVFALAIDNASDFDKSPPPSLDIPDSFPTDSSSTFVGNGTEVKYTIDVNPRDLLVDMVSEAVEACGLNQNDTFIGSLGHHKNASVFPNRFAALLAAYLRRFSYAADVLNLLKQKDELSGTKIEVSLKCSDPVARFGTRVGELFDGITDFEFNVRPTYLLASEWASPAPAASKPGLAHDALGDGGQNLTRHFRAFNELVLTTPAQYESLLRNARGNLPSNIDEYRSNLFPRINGLVLTIGRIPHLEQFLPAGARRVISANGTVTSHDLDVTRGRNQEYVRCFDLVVDVDAELNYGKTQITDMHLVGRIRRYVDDAYLATIQAGTGKWVGKIQTGPTPTDVYLGRPDLPAADLVTRKIPQDENDVIGLFFELLGRGALAGYQIFGLSQSDRYDGRALIIRHGSTEFPPMPPTDDGFDTVEFKLHAMAVVAEFESGEKSSNDIQVLVAWDEGSTLSPRFGFDDITNSSLHSPDDVVPGATRVLVDTTTGTEIQVVLLSDLVDAL